MPQSRTHSPIPAAVAALSVLAAPATARAEIFPGDDTPTGEPPTARERLFADPRLPELTFNQNRADELEVERDAAAAASRPAPAGDELRVRAIVRALALAVVDGRALAEDAAGGNATAGRDGTRGIRLAARGGGARYLVASASATPDYARLADRLGRTPGKAARELVSLTQSHPRDARLWQLLGAARLELAQYAGAVEALERTRELGRDTPALHQGLGDALLGAGRPAGALEQFRQGPESGRNRLGRAAALIELERPEAALAALDAAVRLDPGLEPRARAMRAGALKLAGRAGEADALLAEERGAVADDELAERYDRLAEIDLASRDGRWGYRLHVGAGYNDNVALEPDDPRPAPGASRSDEADTVLRESAEAWLRVLGDERTGLVAQAGVDATQHGDRGELDELFVDAGLRGHHALAPRWDLGGGLKVTRGEIDGDRFATFVDLRASATFEPAEWTGTELSVAYSDRDYAFDAIAEEDRDGSRRSVRLTQDFRFDLGGGAARVSPYVSHADTRADGDSIDNARTGYGLDTAWFPRDRLQLFARLGWADKAFDHPHVRSGFTRARDDDYRRFAGGLRYWLERGVYLGLRGHRIDRDSNLPQSFSYEQDAVFAGVTFSRL